MVKFNTASVCLSLLASGIWAAPQPERRQSGITTLTDAQVAAFTPYSWFAAAAWCDPSTTKNWTCGKNCEANSDFKPVASGGDGSDVQFWYVGYSPSLQSVVVAHQGTDTSKIEPIITDILIVQTRLDRKLFPGVARNVAVHAGFADSQEDTAGQVLEAVQSTIRTYGATKVALVGHSLGAAISLLDSVYLPPYIGNVSFKTVLYGLPRVGNQAFADYVDAHVTDLTHINNKKDPVPIIPGRSIGYHHPSGEVHIQENEQWVACPGQDNPSKLCIVGAVPTIFDGDSDDHSGPYNGITLRC